MIRIVLLILCQLFTMDLSLAQTPLPQAVEGDVVLRNFRFRSAAVLPELRLHYRTLGRLERDANGRARNAVLIMHGTGGSGAQFMRAEFAGELFGAGGSGKSVACSICHGDALKGLGNVPRLAGLHPIYIARQLYLFKDGSRNGIDAQLMKKAVAQLTDEDILALSAYLGSLAP